MGYHRQYYDGDAIATELNNWKIDFMADRENRIVARKLGMDVPAKQNPLKDFSFKGLRRIMAVRTGLR